MHARNLGLLVAILAIIFFMILAVRACDAPNEDTDTPETTAETTTETPEHTNEEPPGGEIVEYDNAEVIQYGVTELPDTGGIRVYTRL